MLALALAALGHAATERGALPARRHDGLRGAHVDGDDSSSVTMSWSERLYTAEGMHHLATDGLPDEGLAPLTRWAQRWMHRRLHPPRATCRDQRYVVMHPHLGGIGSQVHVFGVALGYALQESRQFVLLRENDHLSQGQAYCDANSSWCSRVTPQLNPPRLTPP